MSKYKCPECRSINECPGILPNNNRCGYCGGPLFSGSRQGKHKKHGSATKAAVGTKEKSKTISLTASVSDIEDFDLLCNHYKTKRSALWREILAQIQRQNRAILRTLRAEAKNEK